MASSARSDRLEARVTSDQKALLRRAAAIRGQSVTDFVVSTAQAEAEAVVRGHDVITLTAGEAERFVELILHPGKAGSALTRAVRRYKNSPLAGG
jgi:uncharacterized protein (DUF1778 family)